MDACRWGVISFYSRLVPARLRQGRCQTYRESGDLLTSGCRGGAGQQASSPLEAPSSVLSMAQLTGADAGDLSPQRIRHHARAMSGWTPQAWVPPRSRPGDELYGGYSRPPACGGPKEDPAWRNDPLLNVGKLIASNTRLECAAATAKPSDRR